MPNRTSIYPTNLDEYAASYGPGYVACDAGRQGEVKHSRVQRSAQTLSGIYQDQPPTPEGSIVKLRHRVTICTRLTVIQNARNVRRRLTCRRYATIAATVGPVETWKSECVSIWHPGHHDQPFGMRG